MIIGSGGQQILSAIWDIKFIPVPMENNGPLFKKVTEPVLCGELHIGMDLMPADFLLVGWTEILKRSLFT